MPVVFSLTAIRRARRDHRFRSGLFDRFDKSLRIITFVGDQIIEGKVSDQTFGFSVIRTFAARDNKAQSVAEGIAG